MPRQRAVDEWFEAYENPMKPVVQRIREVVLAADPRVPGDHPRLEGTGDTSRVMKLGSQAEVDAAAADIERIPWQIAGLVRSAP